MREEDTILQTLAVASPAVGADAGGDRRTPELCCPLGPLTSHG